MSRHARTAPSASSNSPAPAIASSSWAPATTPSPLSPGISLRASPSVHASGRSLSVRLRRDGSDRRDRSDPLRGPCALGAKRSCPASCIGAGESRPTLLVVQRGERIVGAAEIHQGPSVLVGAVAVVLLADVFAHLPVRLQGVVLHHHIGFGEQRR